jgi:hypothetical protein
LRSDAAVLRRGDPGGDVENWAHIAL